MCVTKSNLVSWASVELTRLIMALFLCQPAEKEASVELYGLQSVHAEAAPPTPRLLRRKLDALCYLQANWRRVTAHLLVNPSYHGLVKASTYLQSVRTCQNEQYGAAFSAVLAWARSCSIWFRFQNWTWMAGHGGKCAFENHIMMRWVSSEEKENRVQGRSR